MLPWVNVAVFEVNESDLTDNVYRDECSYIEVIDLFNCNFVSVIYDYGI